MTERKPSVAGSGVLAFRVNSIVCGDAVWPTRLGGTLVCVFARFSLRRRRGAPVGWSIAEATGVFDG